MLTHDEVCRLLGISRSTFYARRRQLKDLGFPPRHPVLKRWHRLAVERWLESTAGLAGGAEEESIEF